MQKVGARERLRFDCEALAISLGRYYSDREKSARAMDAAAIQEAPAETSEYEHCDDRVDEIYANVGTILDAEEKMRLADNDPGSIRGDKLSALPVGTKTSIATNLIQVFVISEFRRRMGYEGKIAIPIDSNIASDAIDVIMTQSDLLSVLRSDGLISNEVPRVIEASIICSPLMMLYAVIGDLLLGAKNIPVFKTEFDVDKVFDHYQASVTHYDDWRYGELRKFAKRLFKESRN